MVHPKLPGHSGIFHKTGGKFEVNAGQHIFKGGAKVSSTWLSLPDVKNPYILQYLVKNKENKVVLNKTIYFNG